MRVDLGRRLRTPLLCVIVALAATACGGGKPTSTGSAFTSSKLPARVATAKVLAAVKAAETTRSLPKAISHADLEAAASDAVSQWAIPDCDPSYQTASLSSAGIAACTGGATTYTHTMVIIGDSNAAMWASSFDLIGRRIGWRVVDLTKNNCGPAALHYFQYQLNHEFAACDKWQTWRTAYINRIKPSVVVMIGYVDGGNLGPKQDLTADVWKNGLVKTARGFAPGTKVAMVGNQPHLTTNPDVCAADHASDLSSCNVPLSTVPTSYNGAYQQAAAAVGGTYVDVTPWFCGSSCPVAIAGNLAYSGSYHVDNQYGNYLSGAMQAALAPVLT